MNRVSGYCAKLRLRPAFDAFIVCDQRTRMAGVGAWIYCAVASSRQIKSVSSAHTIIFSRNVRPTLSVSATSRRAATKYMVNRTGESESSCGVLMLLENGLTGY